jgi:hypothetical protein
MHIEPVIQNFRLIKNHPYLRALADISLAGFVMRGIKLEEGACGDLYLGFPGRKVQGGWQLVCDWESETARERLLAAMVCHYTDMMVHRYAGLREAA